MNMQVCGEHIFAWLATDLRVFSVLCMTFVDGDVYECVPMRVPKWSLILHGVCYTQGTFLAGVVAGAHSATAHAFGCVRP